MSGSLAIWLHFRSAPSLCLVSLIFCIAPIGAETNSPAGEALPEGPPIAKGLDSSASSILSIDQQKLIDSFQADLEAAREYRLNKSYGVAEKKLISLLERSAPEEIKRPALLELAFVNQDEKQWQKAQKLFAEYVRRYPKDPALPEVLFRQAYTYREMGVPALALSKLYAVISTCLNLRLEQIEYYQKLVVRAQAEIAETYYLQGQLEEAADYLSRLLKLDSTDLNRPEVLYKLARCQAGLSKHSEVVACARLYLEKYPNLPDAPEIRFFLSSSLKKLGRKSEALQETMVLLKNQEENAKGNPQLWRYWQQRAGNDIANQLYAEGDYVNALLVYQSLAQLNTAPEWQLPVWYQIGLAYENLKQHPKAAEIYDQIIQTDPALAQQEPNPALQALIEMAAWRKHCLAWEEKARLANQQLQREEARF